MKFTKLFGILGLALCTAFGTMAQTPNVEVPAVAKKSHSFIVANDLGRNGYYEQKPIAALMGELAENMEVEFVAALGDIHHYMGVASVNDPLWMTNYELIYSNPELLIPWYTILGNHEYRGNTQAVLDYAAVSSRWCPKGRYYTVEQKAGEKEKALLVFIDTTPLIDKYHEKSETYPDVAAQDWKEQIAWIEETLKNSDAKWKIVLGHHPVVADTDKPAYEREDMQARLKPLLDKYGVDLYIGGHIHNFQHIRPAGSVTNYVVNSSGSLARPVNSIEGTVFCSSDAGFSVISLEDSRMTLYMINGQGKIIYSFPIEK